MRRRPQLYSYRLLALGSAVITAGWFWLQRDPPRCPPDDANAILAPADGRVLLIERGSSPGWVPEPAWRIVIYLSLFNVHVQRAPVAGRVGLIENHGGGHHLAFEPQAATNAGHTLGIENPHGRILVIRSAGMIARRVSTTVFKGNKLAAGQRIGRILLGSRTEVFLPDTVRVCIPKGKQVRAGETILAHWEI